MFPHFTDISPLVKVLWGFILIEIIVVIGLVIATGSEAGQSDGIIRR